MVGEGEEEGVAAVAAWVEEGAEVIALVEAAVTVPVAAPGLRRPPQGIVAAPR